MKAKESKIRFEFEEKIYNPHQEYRGQIFNLKIGYEFLEEVCKLVYKLNKCITTSDNGFTVINTRPEKNSVSLSVVYNNKQQIEKFRNALVDIKIRLSQNL